MQTFKLPLTFLYLIPVLLFAQNENSIAWQIDKNGKTAYLIGTLNPLYTKMYNEHFEGAEKLLDKVEQLVFEMNYYDPINQAKVTKAVLNDPFKDYRKVFTRKQFKKLWPRPYSYRYIYYDELNPYYTLRLLSPSSINNRFSSIMNMEYFLAFTATRKEIAINGIKTFEEWELTYSKYLRGENSITDEFNRLVGMKKNKKTIREKYAAKLDLFKRQEIDLLSKSDSNIDTSFPEPYHELWLPAIDGFMNSKRTLFIINIAYLGGHDGLLSALREGGYTLSPVALSDL